MKTALMALALSAGVLLVTTPATAQAVDADTVIELLACAGTYHAVGDLGERIGEVSADQVQLATGWAAAP